MRINRSVLTVLAVALLILVFGVVAQAGPLQPRGTFTQADYSADGNGGTSGNLQVETTAAAPTVLAAFMYNVTFAFAGVPPAATNGTLAGNAVVLNRLLGTDPTCCLLNTYFADVTGIVAPIINGQAPGITNIAYTLANAAAATVDGAGLVVIYTAPTIPANQSVSVLDGGQGGPAIQNTQFTLGGPLDKTVPGFAAILSLGINFSFQGGAGPGTPDCGSGAAQFSRVDVNGTRLTSCAGNYDDGFGANGGLITVGGVGDSTNNPTDPFCQATQPCAANPAVQDDELYDISALLAQGILAVQLTTSNTSNDDSIFVAILKLTAEIIDVCPQPPCIPQAPAPSALVMLGSGLLSAAGAGWFLRRRR